MTFDDAMDRWIEKDTLCTLRGNRLTAEQTREWGEALDLALQTLAGSAANFTPRLGVRPWDVGGAGWRIWSNHG